MLANIKTAQLLKYHSAHDEEKVEIVLNPVTVFHKALENCKPVLTLTKVYKGGVRYNVGISCTFLTLSLADNFFNPCKVGKLFSENLQNRGYVQTSQLIIYKNKENINWISNYVILQ